MHRSNSRNRWSHSAASRFGDQTPARAHPEALDPQVSLHCLFVVQTNMTLRGFQELTNCLGRPNPTGSSLPRNDSNLSRIRYLHLNACAQVTLNCGSGISAWNDSCRGATTEHTLRSSPPVLVRCYGGWVDRRSNPCHEFGTSQAREPDLVEFFRET